MDFKVTILGANSALPVHGRYPSSQYIQIHNHHLLVDCGEGTQLRLREVKAKWAKIDHIFISHLHGDHFFGLPGLLSSLSLLGRKNTMYLFGPYGIKKVLEGIFEGCGLRLNYELIFHELDASKSTQCFENQIFTVTTIPLNHRIPTNGYLFRQKEQAPNIISEKIAEHGLSIDQIKAVKSGSDVTLDDGTVIPNKELTRPAKIPKSYAYCSDTRYKPDIIPIIKNIDLLYHEATYLHDRMDLAEFSMHTTAKEAGQLAKAAEVKRLLVGHYSSRYEDVTPLQLEAKKEFEYVEVALSGKVFDV